MAKNGVINCSVNPWHCKCCLPFQRGGLLALIFYVPSILTYQLMSTEIYRDRLDISG